MVWSDPGSRSGRLSDSSMAPGRKRVNGSDISQSIAHNVLALHLLRNTFCQLMREFSGGIAQKRRYATCASRERPPAEQGARWFREWPSLLKKMPSRAAGREATVP